MALREPDKPTVVLDAGNISEYLSEHDELSEEVKQALLGLYRPEDVDKARAKQLGDRGYHDEQAHWLAKAGWTEIKHGWLDDALVDEERNWLWPDTRRYYYDDEGKEYGPGGLPRGVPTLYQFYNDLYGLTPGVWNNAGLEVLVNHRDRKHPYQTYGDYTKFVHALEPETSFIYMGFFWKSKKNEWLTSRANAMTSLGGFCVDIDRRDDENGHHFGAEITMRELLEEFDKYPELMPNYVHLSGSGVQLWYVFGKQFALLSKKSPRRAKYNDLLKKLYAHFESDLPKGRFKVDTSCAHINCALRAPGSPAKSHYPTRLFMCATGRRITDVMSLNEYLGGELCWYDVEDMSAADWAEFRERKAKADAARLSQAATEKQLAYIDRLHAMGCLADEEYAVVGTATKKQANELIQHGETIFTDRAERRVEGGCIKTTAGHVVKLKPRSPKLYDYTLRRIQEDTPAGTRYWACFGLAGIAWNCHVPKEQLKNDMEALVDTDWGRQTNTNDHKPFNLEDVNAAVKGYNELGSLRTTEQLEKHLGWDYAPPQKRNGRSRRDHLWADWFITDQEGNQQQVVNTARENRRLASGKSRKAAGDSRRQRALEALTGYLDEHPTASKRECCRELSMSLTTVVKYWEEACETDGITDTRTGNHSPRQR